MKRRRKSSKNVADKPKKPQEESKRKSCARKHKRKKNCVEQKKSRRQKGPKSAKNGSEINLNNEKLRKEREMSAKDKIRLNLKGSVQNEIANRRSKKS